MNFSFIQSKTCDTEQADTQKGLRPGKLLSPTMILNMEIIQLASVISEVHY